MGVDHGLGGKNNEKSRTRRLKKAKHVASIAKAALTKKKEVLFDDAARVNYLTGFRKRKQERREYGHAMEILKKQKKKLDKRKEIRSAVSQALQERDSGEAAGSDAEQGVSDGEEAGLADRTTFADAGTTAMFGGAVSVVVDSGIAEEMDRNFLDSVAPPVHKKVDQGKKEPTKLEKALSKARFNLHNAPKKKKTVVKNKGDDTAKDLYQRAVGKGKGGKRESKKEKGKNKGKGKKFRK